MSTVCEILILIALLYRFAIQGELSMQSIDINGLSQHQVMLLLLVAFGLGTPYDMLSKAGLGVGQTSPFLKKMKGAGILADLEGARNSVRYTLTRLGEEALRRALLPVGRAQQSLQADLYESLPRAITLAWLNAGPDAVRIVLMEARASLERLIQKRQLAAEERKQQIVFLMNAANSEKGNPGQGLLVASVLQWLKAEFDKELYQHQEEALKQLAGLIDMLPAAPPLPV